jgi:hypothetical protein
MNTGEDRAWSPYMAGALSGIVFILSVWFASKFVGASTTFVRSAGMVEKLFSAERVAKMDYFVKEAPKIDWHWLGTIGLLPGDCGRRLRRRPMGRVMGYLRNAGWCSPLRRSLPRP